MEGGREAWREAWRHGGRHGPGSLWRHGLSGRREVDSDARGVAGLGPARAGIRVRPARAGRSLGLGAARVLEAEWDARHARQVRRHEAWCGGAITVQWERRAQV